ncbi:chromatin-remodeling histone chaperone [Saccharomycopsis crataegensis]|uniref:Transcription elongation factor Spt6 n=1 Tax=Saccharomycopsis crataegensis TaxID=43959 RepID=A0AAV5QS22_9ASCO|nr:chromatin-remodeling histone chaperone [Saccharomycopsis crataegensis]
MSSSDEEKPDYLNRDAEESDNGGAIDSSDEEDDDDENEIAKVRDGFIVDDEDENEGSEDSSSERRHRRKKRKHKEKTPKDEDDALDEDDLDLLMENTGAAPRAKSKFKRLKKASSEDDKSQSTSNRASNALDDIFSDEEEEPEDEAPANGGRRRTDHDEMDDFIEEDSDDEEDRDVNHASRDRRYRPQATSVIAPQYSDIDQEKLDQLFEIFGDGTDYQWALDLEDIDGDNDDGEEGDGVPKLTDIFEQTELKEKMLTEEDNQVRITDIPERFQEMRSVVKNYELDIEDFEFEKTWIRESMAVEKYEFFQNNEYLIEPFEHAVGDVLTFMCEDNLEVPFIWTHRRDFITHAFKDPETGEFILKDLLDEDDLWRICQLDIDFHSLLSKKKTVISLLTKLGKLDEFEEELEGLKKINEYQDFYDYVLFKFSKELKEIQKESQKDDDDLEEIDEDEEEDDYNFNRGSNVRKSKDSKIKSRRHQKYSIWDRVRDSDLNEMIENFGITASQVATNISQETRQYFTEDPTEEPERVLAEICTRADSVYTNINTSMNLVKKLYAEELYHEPRIRHAIRETFANYSVINVKLTEKGKVKINNASPNYDFKYLMNKPVTQMIHEPDLFLRMLIAEQENLIEIVFHVQEYDQLLDKIFSTSFASDSESEIGSKWNEIRRASFDLAIKRLNTLARMHLKEELRKQCENSVFLSVRNAVNKKLNQAPYRPPGYEIGAIPYTLTLSAGEGNFHSDAVVGVYMNEFGEVKEFIKFEEHPLSPEFIDSFVKKVQSLNPDVIGINGYNARSKKLYDRVLEIVNSEKLRPAAQSDGDYREYENNEPPILDVIFVADDIARLYENSVRAKQEFPDKSSLFRYCVALGRYLQSPLLEYINMKDDVTSVFFYRFQHLLSNDRLKEAITTAFVDIVNLVGVEINRAIRESYYASCLQYVAGLGPRKASGLLQSIQTKSSSGLVNRQQLITSQLTSKTIFLNCASFLKFTETVNGRYADEADVLDETRIHPEDYTLAIKMAADALELDEEDIDDLEKGEGVIRKLEEGDNVYKLNDLILEDYALELENKSGKRKRATLYMIKEELLGHYDEFRRKFHIMNPQEIFVSLTGETPETFYPGMICTVVLKKIADKYVQGVTQFMVQCRIGIEHLKENNDRRRIGEIFHLQQAIQAKILEIDYEKFMSDGSVLKRDLQNRDNKHKQRNPAEWNRNAELEDERTEKQKLIEESKPKKVVEHPYFHNFNSKQAEDYLASRSRGDLVIRPSSRGEHHLAITWKVDNNLYQHLDVTEQKGKNKNNQEVKSYFVSGRKYSDLDELITFHIAPIVKLVEALINSDKFYNKSRADAESYLDSYIRANEKRGYYIFCFDHKRPGRFSLLFKGNEKSSIHTLPIEVNPDGYVLANYNYQTVGLLTNGFKTLAKNKFRPLPKNDGASSVHRYNNGGGSRHGGPQYRGGPGGHGGQTGYGNGSAYGGNYGGGANRSNYGQQMYNNNGYAGGY